jgi:hypothetical protein
MNATSIRPSLESRPQRREGVRPVVVSVLAAWLALVVLLGARGAFVAAPGTPPVSMGLAVALPLLVFFTSLRLSPGFRDFVLSLDLRLVAGIQAWRWAGLGFLSLYAHKILPGVFALPAGLGDMAIGFAAPWIVLGLVRSPGFAASGAFIRWNVLGILDLVVAVSIGTASAFLATGAPGEVSTAPMATLPLLLIPGFLVPLFLMLHATALMQSRLLSRDRV